MSFYNAWGFTDNPFSSVPLIADEHGNKLLIGRERELKDLIDRIENAPKIPTVEGGLGAGKTSLVNVATYRLTRDFLSGKAPDLYVACSELFQIGSVNEIPRLEDNFYFAVAQTLISLNEEKYKFQFASSAKEKINSWLNSPTFKGVQFGMSFWGNGGSVGGNESPNTSRGFDASGFRKAVRDWLMEIFALGGGIVCIIDNIELLQESSEARRAIETIRDTLLATTGTRWVLCGANGIMQGVLTSPRLSRRLHSPIVIDRLEDKYLNNVYESRMSVFAKFEGSGQLPLTATAFHILYDALNKNLGNLIAAADEFCQWANSCNKNPLNEKERDDTFYEWFYNDVRQVYAAAKAACKPRALEVLDGIIGIGGSCSPSDFEEFGFKSQQVMRAHVKELEEIGLLESVVDEKDQRRKSIQVTSKGFRAYYQRCQLGVSRSLAQVRAAISADSDLA